MRDAINGSRRTPLNDNKLIAINAVRTLCSPLTSVAISCSVECILRAGESIMRAARAARGGKGETRAREARAPPGPRPPLDLEAARRRAPPSSPFPLCSDLSSLVAPHPAPTVTLHYNCTSTSTNPARALWSSIVERRGRHAASNGDSQLARSKTSSGKVSAEMP